MRTPDKYLLQWCRKEGEKLYELKPGEYHDTINTKASLAMARENQTTSQLIKWYDSKPPATKPNQQTNQTKTHLIGFLEFSIFMADELAGWLILSI